MAKISVICLVVVDRLQVKVEETSESSLNEQSNVASPIDVDSKVGILPPPYISAISPSSAYAAQPAFQGYGRRPSSLILKPFSSFCQPSTKPHRSYLMNRCRKFFCYLMLE